ncbi:IS3 family transposase, partial [Listeria monocytogenes]|nr:IS3 family transposase [Listeria monocytogenes]
RLGLSNEHLCRNIKEKSHLSKHVSESCLDNSPMENFFSILKQELYYGKIYQSQNELKLAIENYIYYYNHYRIKEKLNWKSPVEFRLSNQKTA